MMHSLFTEARASAGAAEVDASGAKIMQCLDVKQAQDAAAIQQAASAFAQDAALVQGELRIFTVWPVSFTIAHPFRHHL